MKSQSLNEMIQFYHDLGQFTNKRLGLTLARRKIVSKRSVTSSDNSMIMGASDNALTNELAMVR